MNNNELVYGLEPFYNRETEILILGSFPSIKSRLEGFYYMNPFNRFYKILDSIFNTNLYELNIALKKEILKQLKIGLSDVVFSCKINGSSDLSIKDYKINDIKAILNNTNVKRIIVNGKKAEELFRKNYSDLISITYFLPSSSSANARFKLDCLVEEWKKAFK